MKRRKEKQNKRKFKNGKSIPPKSFKNDDASINSNLTNKYVNNYHSVEKMNVATNNTIGNVGIKVSSGLPQVNIDLNKTEQIFEQLGKQTSSNKIIASAENKKLNLCLFPLCRVRMHDKNKLQYHLNCHVATGFKCLECDQEFSFWNSLTGHLWRSHKIDMELYCCNECDYKTYSLAKLNNIHKLIHTNVKSFICNICQKGFKNNKQMRNHRAIHKSKSEKLVHECEVCGRKFSDRRQVKLHMDTVHMKLKPFLCNFCGYKSSSRSSLKIHIRQHTGEKPFSCDSCSYTTSDHNSLRRHKWRHTGDKPYKCAYCSYACIQSSTYKVHLKTKHPGQENDHMFTCPECQYRSINKDMYLTHMISVHKQKPIL
ncbi:hypothetical protein HHI36_003085 [Cryptolaemus montrouzieri]|uniref:C2H2-type domain-containing protein n=1 Tax=Cryptolaemus montrouzieri TaxID=559131 RepID=A0ABD2PCG7_9CUCU